MGVMPDLDLFGIPIRYEPPRTGTQPKGYAYPPGSGPDGETCGTCRHCTGFRQAARWHKCELARDIWTCGRGTDILVRSPACRGWEAQREL